MGTKMGFPPGVRIQLRDNSGYSVVENPATTAGIVGFASKGELNKIIQVNTTAEQDAKLGYGYQSYKYNQGMYAARAVLDAGGVVEFVRPYGEEIDRTDPRKRDLKTDAFVVAFDKNAGQYAQKDDRDSFKIEHFAATRFKTDGAAAYGVKRKINNIAEAVVSGSNVDFGLTAAEDYADSEKSRKWDGEHCTDMVLFSILNRDPSYAYRAYDRFEVVGTPQYQTNDTVEVTLASNPTFVIGDTVLLPASGGRNNIDLKATVTDILDDHKVVLKIDEPPSSGNQFFTSVIFSPDTASAIEDGFDYMNIKTAVAGQGVKKFDAIQWGVQRDNNVANFVTFNPSSIKIGSSFMFKNKQGNLEEIRLWMSTPVTANVEVDTDTLVFTSSNMEFVEGDVLSFKMGDVLYTDLVVKTVDDNGAAVVDSPFSQVETSGSVQLTITECSEDVLYADITDANSWTDVANAVVKVMNSSKLGFAKNAVTNDINSASGNKFIVDPNAAFDYAIGDKVVVVLGSDESIPDASIVDAVLSTKLEVTDVNTFNGEITVNAAHGVVMTPGVRLQLLNLSTTSATAYNAVTSIVSDVVNGSSTYVQIIVPADELDASASCALEDGYDRVVVTTTTEDATVTWSDNRIFVHVTDASEQARTVTVKATPQRDVVSDVVTTYIVSSYTMYVSSADQKLEVINNDELSAITSKKDVWNIDVEKSKKVLADSDIGATFLGLGLAKTDYIDVDFDNNPHQVYVLTDEGATIARMYLSIRYRFNGKVYEFDGTIVPYSTSTKVQLGIKYSADYELTDSGLEFVMNDSGVLDYFLENSSYDLSQSLVDGTLNGSVMAIAYNTEDPAIKNDAVWTYNPLNNRSGSTLSTVWNLFLNKDGSDVDMLVSAGMAINNPFMNKIETLNTQVMQAMLNVCEARKDCFAIFDGVSEPDINKALKKDIAATGFVSNLGRWGMLYDGRGLVHDSVYTNGEAEIMKSVQLASIITGNRQSGIYWIPPSGYDQAPVPSAWGTKEKFQRTYNSEDKNCDVGKLSDIHVNATRVNKEGMFIWGDYTLQMEDTAFNQAHVAMLVAGIHKTFYKYLDHKVFRLNTTNLRAQITSDLQDKLNMIKRNNPAGLIDGVVICDDSNNTKELIDQNFLIVDLKLLPPKSARWIILRTSVESTKNGNTISTEIISG